MSQRLGDLLVKEKVLSPEQLEQALKAQKDSGGKDRLGSILVKLGFLSDDDVTGPFGGVFVPSNGANVVDSDRRVSFMYLSDDGLFSEAVWTVFIVARRGEYAQL